ncbi:hypothetical protein MYMA111404_00460 [Mycoplasma marinum]|uniref:SHS2 domain-containing protein n=1 Tax=Mycoplasma marinum TaxID=1937190 RepID=A0A4R0XVA6_9MOLU|nr:hypothetical protein [Mycoplasma marinum]TCG11770.1 hypothetical protein C4B24_01305 [Mycoplasma marinum]
MQRNLVTNVKISRGAIQVVCIERISTELVEIFNDTKWTSNPLEQTRFIKESVARINKVIGGKIKSVIAIVESNKKTNLEIKMLVKEITIASSFVSQSDINNVIKLAEAQYQPKDQSIILVQPVRYEVSGIERKSYNKAPINKRGDKLKVKIAISSISQIVQRYIKDIISNAGLSVSQILTDTHVISQATISNSAIAEGAISVHIGMKRTNVAVNVNSATISTFDLPLGFKHLVEKVSEYFECSNEIARNLIRVHGALSEGANDIIFTTKKGLKTISFTQKHLNTIISQFVNRTAKYAQAFIGRHELFKKLSVVISGEINNFTGVKKFMSKTFSSEFVSFYKPLMFIASNTKNLETIGTTYFIRRYDKVIGKDFNTIVMTNPNTIDTLRNTKQSLFAKFINKIGGKDVRTA